MRWRINWGKTLSKTGSMATIHGLSSWAFAAKDLACCHPEPLSRRILPAVILSLCREGSLRNPLRLSSWAFVAKDLRVIPFKILHFVQNDNRTEWQPYRMTTVQNDNRTEWQPYRMTTVHGLSSWAFAAKDLRVTPVNILHFVQNDSPLKTVTTSPPISLTLVWGGLIMWTLD